MRYKIKDVAKINERAINKKYNGTINYIDTSSVTDNIFNNPKVYSSIKEAPSRARRVANLGDTIISTVRPNMKHTGFIDKVKYKNCIYSTGFAVVTPLKDRVDPFYLYLVLTNNKNTELLQSIGETSTSTYPSVKPSDIENLEHDFPNINKQKEISTTIKMLENKIYLNNKINTNLKLLKTAIFNNMFNSKLLNNLNGKLADIAKIQTGKRPISRSSTYNNENKYPIVGASKIMGYTNSYNIDDSIITTGRVGTHGIIQRFREPVWISDNSFIFTSHYEDYLYEILKNRINYTSLNRGSTQPLITQTDLKNIDIYVPTDEEHRQFKTLIYPITNIEFTLNNEQHKLFKIKNLLLNKFFNSSKLTN